MQILSYVGEAVAVLAMLVASFMAGSYVQRMKLLDEWERVEAEWADLARERADFAGGKTRWADLVYPMSSPSNEPKNK